jgi:hypothetical protein
MKNVSGRRRLTSVAEHTHGETAEVFTCSESAVSVWRMVHNYWAPSTEISPTIISLTFKKCDEMVSTITRWETRHFIATQTCDMSSDATNGDGCYTSQSYVRLKRPLYFIYYSRSLIQSWSTKYRNEFQAHFVLQTPQIRLFGYEWRNNFKKKTVCCTMELFKGPWSRDTHSSGMLWSADGLLVTDVSVPKGR